MAMEYGTSHEPAECPHCAGTGEGEGVTERGQMIRMACPCRCHTQNGKAREQQQRRGPSSEKATQDG
jgi:hypothetical protein